MKFDIKAMAFAGAILWGGATLLVALVNFVCGNYGQRFLEMLSSCYPGYHATHSVVQVLIVSLYAIADGLIGCAVFAWLYNRLIKSAA
ncbi:MAG: hypothetical protein WBE72_00330 [Terracidiphilus sp.]